MEDMKKIGLIDVDGHNFQNLALMKLSSWHKAHGDEVEWVFPFAKYDRIYKSKIFTFTKDDETIYNAAEVIMGGDWIRCQKQTARQCGTMEGSRLLALSAVQVQHPVLLPWLHPPLSVLPRPRQRGRNTSSRADGTQPAGGMDRGVG